MVAARNGAIVLEAMRPRRVWEVDALRGVAIVLMVAFHLMWNLDYFAIVRADVTAGVWLVIGRTSATLFLFLVGLSLHLGAARARRAHDATFVRRQQRRGATIFVWGLMISGVTWLAFGEGFVRFGILHLIGLSIVLAQPLLALGRWNLLLGAGVLVAGRLVQDATVAIPWLLWLGLRPAGFVSVDYYPLLPWFGVVLIGLAAGAARYGRAEHPAILPDLSPRPPIRFLAYLGRHSLIVYVLHQPLLIGVLALGARAGLWGLHAT